DVCPPAAVPRRVRIAHPVRIRVMNSVCGYPLNWSTFHSEGAARYQKVFDDLGYVITAVGKQSMKSHSDSETAGDPVENYCANDCWPAPKEKCSDSRCMSYKQKDSVAPMDRLVVY